jgi:hypothetical protein
MEMSEARLAFCRGGRRSRKPRPGRSVPRLLRNPFQALQTAAGRGGRNTSLDGSPPTEVPGTGAQTDRCSLLRRPGALDGSRNQPRSAGSGGNPTPPVADCHVSSLTPSAAAPTLRAAAAARIRTNRVGRIWLC